MAAYLVVDIDVRDPERYAEYVKVVPATIARYGGRYLARGGKAEALEGTWRPKRFVLLEFPSYERAMEWWRSEEYRAPKALRQAAATATIVLAQGV